MIGSRKLEIPVEEQGEGEDFSPALDANGKRGSDDKP